MNKNLSESDRNFIRLVKHFTVCGFGRSLVTFKIHYHDLLVYVLANFVLALDAFSKFAEFKKI